MLIDRLGGYAAVLRALGELDVHRPGRGLCRVTWDYATRRVVLREHMPPGSLRAVMSENVRRASRIVRMTGGPPR